MRPLLFALCCALAAAPAPPAALVAGILSGQEYRADLASPGDEHAFHLDEFAYQLVDLSVRADPGSGLRPEIRLENPFGQDVTNVMDADRRDGPGEILVRRTGAFAVPGRYVLRVSGRDGTTGAYRLRAAGRPLRNLRGTGFVAVAGGSDFFPFFAPTDARVTLKVTVPPDSGLRPVLGPVTGGPCEDPRLLPGDLPGRGVVTIPLSGNHAATVLGEAGTTGPYRWRARVLPRAASPVPVRLNGEEPPLPPAGRRRAERVASPSQEVAGLAAGAGHLAWRQFRPVSGETSIHRAEEDGSFPRVLAADFAVDPDPDSRAFALGPTRAVVLAAGGLHAFPLKGEGGGLLAAGLGARARVLADGEHAFVLREDGIRRHPLDGAGPSTVAADPALVYLDMAFGGTGLVFAATDGEGGLLLGMTRRDGGGAAILATLSPDPGFQALAARGTDLFIATGNGSGGARLLRISACSPGESFAAGPDLAEPIRALAADELAVYAVVEDEADGARLVRFPRGGGMPTVLVRGDPGDGFSMATGSLAAERGRAFVEAGGSLLRVRRR